ncbi:hypothetical protein HDV06_003594 [Boothiomyces sp. JEL0866]|nr:hypothetical protein HDV06_003594 [Boothiomyces sp. JEL0866]
MQFKIVILLAAVFARSNKDLINNQISTLQDDVDDINRQLSQINGGNDPQVQTALNDLSRIDQEFTNLKSIANGLQ